jgi:hypothetical protein
MLQVQKRDEPDPALFAGPALHLQIRRFAPYFFSLAHFGGRTHFFSVLGYFVGV